MAMWNPWRGCKKYSEGCKFCYIHKGDFKRGIDTSEIKKTPDFDKPIAKFKNGTYKIKKGIVYLAFSTDFLLAEADSWRNECWEMIRKRQDLNFLFLTKRIERFLECQPDDWLDGYENVIVCCTVEDQKNADIRLRIFQELKIKHKCIIAQPLLENIEIQKYLKDIELVIVGGESDINARPLNYDWVLNIRNQCIEEDVNFEFRQCGSHFIKEGKEYNLPYSQLARQAKKADINYQCKELIY